MTAAARRRTRAGVRVEEVEPKNGFRCFVGRCTHAGCRWSVGPTGPRAAVDELARWHREEHRRGRADG